MGLIGGKKLLGVEPPCPTALAKSSCGGRAALPEVPDTRRSRRSLLARRARLAEEVDRDRLTGDMLLEAVRHEGPSEDASDNPEQELAREIVDKGRGRCPLSHVGAA